MLAVANRQTPELPSDLVETVQSLSAGEQDAWLGKRAFPRRKVRAPIWITTLDDSVSHPARGHTMCDFSNSGLALISRERFEPGQLVHADLRINNLSWNVQLQVVYCISSGRYRVGLQPRHIRSTENNGRSSDRDPITLLRKQILIEEIKDEIHQAMHMYDLAIRSCGLFGTRMPQRIRQMLQGLPVVVSSPPHRDRRQRSRLRFDEEIHLVSPTQCGWTPTCTQGVNISQGGVLLLMKGGCASKSIGCGSEEALRILPQMLVVLGFGRRPERLWMPGCVVRGTVAGNMITRTHIAFNERASLRTLVTA